MEKVKSLKRKRKQKLSQRIIAQIFQLLPECDHAIIRKIIESGNFNDLWRWIDAYRTQLHIASCNVDDAKEKAELSSKKDHLYFIAFNMQQKEMRSYDDDLFNLGKGGRPAIKQFFSRFKM